MLIQLLGDLIRDKGSYFVGEVISTNTTAVSIDLRCKSNNNYKII